MFKKTANGTVELDLAMLLKVLWKRIWIIIICGILGGVAAFSYAEFLVTPRYQSSVKMYVNNSGGASRSTLSYLISTTELSAAQSLVSTYIVILNSRTCINEIAQEAGVSYDYKTLSSMISAEDVDGTEIFEITVTSTSAEEAQNIANTIADVLPKRIDDIVDGSSVKVVDYAPLLTTKTYPGITKFTALGILTGIFICAVIIIIIQSLDDYIHSGTYLTDTYPDIPLLAAIPDLMENSQGDAYGNGYEYGYEYSYNNAQLKKGTVKDNRNAKSVKNGGKGGRR